MKGLGLILAGLALGACAPLPAEDGAKTYLGIETRLLDGDLVQFEVKMRGAADLRDVEEYAKCAAAGYTLIRGYGFARHVRTLTDQTGGVLRADAVYTISPAIPRGAITIDAEVVSTACRLNGIPTV